MIGPIAAALAGSLCAWLGFAPTGWWWFPYFGLAVLAALLARSRGIARGALLGFAFGLGYFMAGVSWVRVSMNEFGGMPLALAWLSAALFCAFLALYVALACAVTAWAMGGRRRPWRALPFALVFAAAWTLSESLRAHLFTGFEWLALGSSQLGPFAPAPLAAVFGQLGLSAWVALIAGYLGGAVAVADTASGRWWVLARAVICFFISGLLSLLHPSEWFTEPVGPALSVSLVQGNVAQSMKWDPAKFIDTVERYGRLVQASRGALIILPETAYPAPLSRLPPEALEALRRHAVDRGGNVLFGVPQVDGGRFYNAAVTLGVDPAQQYRKVHLVPFGEYMPLRGPLAWFYANLNIPMSDFAAGERVQSPLAVGGQHLGISICYEDAFARDVRRTLPEATLLVNLSNDAWFGHSAAAEQHLQLAQMRAIESARPMLRANNTGVTAIVDERGRISARLPGFAEGVLEASVQGRRGATPYVRFGDWPVWLAALAILAHAALRRRRDGRQGS